MIRREVEEGSQAQGVDEIIAYTIDVDPHTPVVIAATATKAYDVTDGAHTDVSATVLSGTTTVVTTVITTPLVQALTAGRTYRIEVKYTCSGNTYEPYFFIQAEI